MPTFQWTARLNACMDGRRVGESHGSVLLTTLAVGLCVMLMCVTLGSLAVYSARTVASHGASRRAFWMARMVALDSVRALQNGRLKTGQTSWTVDSATIVRNVSSGTSWSIVVDATTQKAIDVVRLTCDKSSGKVLTWLDNSQP